MVETVIFTREEKNNDLRPKMTNSRSELPPNDEVDGVGERDCRLRQRVRGLAR